MSSKVGYMKSSLNKERIIEILEEIANLLELQGENSFKVRAYRRCARSLMMLEDDLVKRVKMGTLTEIEGIGDHLAQKISELVLTGKLPY